MPIDLSTVTSPIDPADPPYAALLDNLQGNILKPHGRDYAAHVFFRFSGDQASAREVVGQLAKSVTSASEQTKQAAANKVDRI